NFCANEQTAVSNRFQLFTQKVVNSQELALAEFDQLAMKLREAGVRVHVFDDTPVPHTPDALFPNNWVSFHADGTAVLYPMLALNRRNERRTDILESLSAQYGFRMQRVLDLTHRESEHKFLEGTGSLVLDRVNRFAYVCMSPRTDLDVLGEFAQLLDYEIVTFDAFDTAGNPIYHTNVMMSVGTTFAAICAEAIRADERPAVLNALRATQHHIIELSFDQMNAFAGNMLELGTTTGGRVLALSTQAHASLNDGQRQQLIEHSGVLVTAAIPTIETLGGGSVRCMLAEVHLPRRTSY
ncbi:MAG: amidinotransferase, partial [Candidatus Obscuribacterales bacterium]|nr:amidinotransferase [Steroidobacteraceae bacterium]